MGNVSARDHGYDDSPDSGSASVSLGSIAARVTRVHVKGLVRTKDDMVVATIEPVLKVKQFEELVLAAQEARNRLQGLGCFQGVEIQIDTSSEGGSSDYEVTFAVEELKRIKGSVNTMVGNQEGSVLVGVRLPNALGRGERFQVDYTQGYKNTNQFNASFAKPIFASVLDKDQSPLLANVTTSLFQQMHESPASGYKETGRGGMVDLNFLSAPQVAHNLQLESVWRQLNCLNSASAFAVREHCGHTLKAALRHILTVDRRDDPILPAEGSFFKLNHEFAGLAGDIGFFKSELEVQGNWPIFVAGSRIPCVLQSAFHCGHLMQTQKDKTVTLSDHFYLGGPLNVRGFDLHGLGPNSEGNSTGGLTYWATGLHLYTPLPFRRSDAPGFGDLFRTHSFVTAGNLLPHFAYNSSRTVSRNFDDAIQNFRLSYGFGIALKVGGIARIEVNYCLPVKAQKGDRVSSGLQFGLGVNFL